MSASKPNSAARLVVGLYDPGASDLHEAVGNKAATLARLATRGFSVPEGFVVTTSACDRIVAADSIPEDVWVALVSHLRHLGDGPVAVRSSGWAEDLVGASYAGQYETVLGVVGHAALAAAVRRCLSSANSAQVRAYRGSDAPAPMAVLVQKMVPAEAAGVAFTANPITGDAEVLVSAVKGLGDRLASGEASPDEWVVRGDCVTCVRSPEGALDCLQVGAIVEQARAAEDLLGAPQDVEWAIANGEVFVLQSRPITALPVAPAIDVPTEGFWFKDTSHFPTPLTPFGASVYLPALTDALPPFAEEFGLLFEGVEQRSFGGEVYARAIPLGGKDRRLPPPWVMWLAARLVPSLRHKARTAQAVIDSRLPERMLDSWEREWRPAFVDEVGELKRVDLASLDDDALVAHLDRLEDLLGRGELLHFRLHGPHSLALYELGAVCQKLLGWGMPHTLQLLTGSSTASSAPGLELHELAERIATEPLALAAITSSSEGRLAELRRSAPWAAQAFDDFLTRHGHRTTSYDPGDATLLERSETVLGVLADQARAVALGGVAWQAGEPGAALAQARAALRGRSEDDRRHFEAVLSEAQRAYGHREDNIYWLDNQPCALLRCCALEIGRRLAARGMLSHGEDAVFLREGELRGLLTGERDVAQHAVIARRKAERAWVVAHPGPPSYGKYPGEPPDLSVLPPALRLVNDAFLNQVRLLEAPPTAQATGDELHGVAGSPGRCSGTVRVVVDEADFGKLGPGEVLVAPTTSPPWSVLFLQAAAVVTDGGGVLSHTAVIAREYGIPAVLATGEATRRLSDGDVVSVDGNAGVVSIIRRQFDL